jgi:predicted phage terminase large subunit-like protein
MSAYFLFELGAGMWRAKALELNNFGVCTTWGKKNKYIYLLHVYRRRLEFPDLKRAIQDLASHWRAMNILIEDKASGKQLMRDVKREGLQGITCYDSRNRRAGRGYYGRSRSME